jgi:hypothetical protein
LSCSDLPAEVDPESHSSAIRPGGNWMTDGYQYQTCTWCKAANWTYRKG